MRSKMFPEPYRRVARAKAVANYRAEQAARTPEQVALESIQGLYDDHEVAYVKDYDCAVVKSLISQGLVSIVRTLVPTDKGITRLREEK